MVKLIEGNEEIIFDMVWVIFPFTLIGVLNSRVISGCKTLSSSPTGWLPVGQSSVMLALGRLADW